MAIDHLIFNRLKWFNVTDNADSIKANGRSFYALPSKVKLTNDSTTLWTIHGSGLSHTFGSGKVFDVLGAYKNTYNEQGKKRYIISYSYSNQDYILSVSENDCTPIWGVKPC